MNGLTTMIQGSINTTRIILPFIDELSEYNAPPLPPQEPYPYTGNPYQQPSSGSTAEFSPLSLMIGFLALFFGCCGTSCLMTNLGIYTPYAITQYRFEEVGQDEEQMRFFASFPAYAYYELDVENKKVQTVSDTSVFRYQGIFGKQYDVRACDYTSYERDVCIYQAGTDKLVYSLKREMLLSKASFKIFSVRLPFEIIALVPPLILFAGIILLVHKKPYRVPKFIAIFILGVLWYLTSVFCAVLSWYPN
jgi:hypothetical protein